MGATPTVMGEGVENEFALDFFNRVANKPRNDLIRQVTEGAGDRRSEHTYLQEPRYEVDGSTRTISPLRARCAGMVNNILMCVFLACFEEPSGLFRPVPGQPTQQTTCRPLRWQQTNHLRFRLSRHAIEQVRYR